MKIEVEVQSKETIKPSNPNPNHPQLHKLSFLDQIAPPIFMPLVLFYSKENYLNLTYDEISNKLKKSLSKALNEFYPLAGRIKSTDNCHIECTDEGVHYVEAKARDCKLSQLLENPTPGELNKLLPFELHDPNKHVLGLQVTLFDCGGLAVGLVMSHKVADAMSFITFSNSWAAIANDENHILNPKFDLAKHFPPTTDVSSSGINPSYGITKQNIASKIFLFNATSIASLQDKYANSMNPTQRTRPSRVEALSAFIWSRFRASIQIFPKENDVEDQRHKIHAVLSAVNLRPRADPPIPNNHFGNISKIAVAIASEDNEDGCYGIIGRTREAVKNSDLGFVKKIQQKDEELFYLRERLEVVHFAFTSLCRFPGYEADFGWGKPAWAGLGRLTYPSLVSLVDTKNGDGIEAWVNLRKEDMAVFENDKELLDYGQVLGN